MAKKKERGKLFLLEKAEEVARYYGFTTFSTVRIEKDDYEKTRTCLEIEFEDEDGYKKNVAIHPEEKVALLRNYFDKNPNGQIQPSMFYRENMAGERRSHSQSEMRFYLDIIGTTKSIAEAMLIKTGVEILKEEGFTNLSIEINSIGDKESLSKFTREVSAYYRKNLNALPAHCRQTFKLDPFDVLMCQNEKCQLLKEKAPNPISSLSENSRKHFSEILEYLEVLKIPYRINDNLLYTKKLCSGTIFEIKNAETDTTLGIGMRYNGLAKKLGFKKELGAVGIHCCFKRNKMPIKNKSRQNLDRPKIYFIQLGFNAKLKSLEIIEMLRKEKIIIAQGLVKDKLEPQLEIAEKSKIPYLLILGQKEAMENNIIVRNMNSRSQETIPIDKLPEYLKKMK